MLRQHYTRLPKYQQQLVSVLLGAFVILLINSLLLILFDRSTAMIYMSMVLMHVVLGVLVIAPVLFFLIFHIAVMPTRKNRGATAAGVFTAISLSVLFTTGFLLVVAGATYGDRWMLWLHIISTVTSVFGFIGHVSLKKGIRYHFLDWGGLWKQGVLQAIKHPLSITLLSGIFVSAVFFMNLWLESRTPKFIETGQDNILEPGQAVLAHEGFLEEVDLSRSESCGQAGCHPDIFQQWEASAHHFSSFNNPYYRKTVELMVDEKGTGPVRWCASCHDPLVLFTGRMQGTFDMDHSTAQAGLTCLSCHAVEGLRDVKGNGRLVMAKPDEYPLARSENPLAQWLHNKLVLSKPEPHRRAMLKPMHRTAEFCGGCHKVGIPPAVNDYRWKRGQNQYDSWHASGVSGNTVRSFYLPAQAKTCFDCHMPLVPSTDQGNDNGFIRSHRFPAANTTLPMLKNHPEQLKTVQDFLQDGIVTIDLFRVEVNNREYSPEEALPVLKAGDDVRISLVVRNRKVGHNFPEGTNDSNELWIELLGKDQHGQTLLASGLLEPDGQVDSTAHFFNVRLVNRQSRLIGKRDVQNWVETIYANLISPGTARNVHYRFKIPAGVEIAEFQATLFYRKFRQAYHQWVFRDVAAEEVPVQLLTPIAKTIRRVNEKFELGFPLWERWNDFGIALLLEGDTRRALEAFQKVTEIAADNPEGPINQGRVLIAEGQVERAWQILEQAESRRPGYLKTAYFRGEVHKAYGDYEKSLVEWKRVAEAYPQDRVLLMGIGRLHYLLGQYDEALVWCERVLQIDPEDLGGLYNKMLCLGALGRTEEFERAQKLYEYHKIDDSAKAVTAQHKKQHPMANREAQMIHEHELHPVVKSSSPSNAQNLTTPQPVNQQLKYRGQPGG